MFGIVYFINVSFKAQNMSTAEGHVNLQKSSILVADQMINIINLAVFKDIIIC